ncbi:hypothetical protein DQ04_04501040 [Trypanosoma grayi]|uniref:hypothetical protein n=1 Tax=Trypanosoma grayi TaxID=71804 RepID=UPI0004F41A60|nr:hypothetical protein DQ04_04501040 [Trypanosoma grayi]KEG09878.1 hypothetical protein DQ04_04501040 [Trypanosoma grayi]
MSGTAPAVSWRLKVINGCDGNGDLLLPLVPQPSLLQHFYAQWRDEDEDRHKAAERLGAERAAEERRSRGGKKKKKAATAASRSRITARDWLKKIPHVVLGRHTCLPRHCRLRHVCVSRLHCRIAYVGDAATHRLIVSRYPSARRAAGGGVRSDARSEGSSRDNDGEDDAGAFPGPHYRLLNCGANPLYVNDEALPCGESRCLREHDVVAFLENPFDEEGGVLQPLGTEDAVKCDGPSVNGEDKQETVEAKEEDEWLVTESTVRALFDSTSKGDNTSTAAGADPKGACQLPAFVEVNGVRIARYRPLRIPSAIQHQFATSATTATARTSLHGGTPLKRAPSLAVEHNRLVGSPTKDDGKVIESRHDGVLNQNFCFTPPPKLLSPQARKARQPERQLKNEENDHDDGVDIIEDVVSPLQQRLVSSPGRCNGAPASPEAKAHLAPGRSGTTCEEPLPVTVLPPRLPVYVFARRSPSPVGFTHQAPSIGRYQSLQPQLRHRHVEKSTVVVMKKGGMTEWVEEDTAVDAAMAVGQQVRRKRGRPPRSKKA